jgi:AraC family transcriptional regulator, transcriptional activator of pobA
MSPPRIATPTRQILDPMSIHLPTYLLYGEEAGLPPADVMHAESIAERSSLHSWEIRPHRHEALLQVFNIDRGRVEVVLDDQRQALSGPCVITVMPLAVHGFRWTSDVKGTVFTMLESHVRTLLVREEGLREAVLRSRAVSVDAPGRRELGAAVDALRGEYGQHAAWRASAIDAALLRLFIALGRGLPPAAAPNESAGDRAQQHVRRFRALVDERFREQPALAEFASELGITTTQLNRVCRSVVGHPALAVLHARICLEAQRELAYTTLSIKHIAFKLGFTDAGYFTRFFEREAGANPSSWRAAIQAGR